MSSYDAIARFYDNFVDDPTKKAVWLRQLIQKYQPNAKSVLELACGTGSILKVLSKDYDVAGLDNSAGMLQEARKKLPHVSFTEADMSNFDLQAKYDVVICVYDSINHLVDFSQWNSMFTSAARSLNQNGLFIFDMNTIEFLEKINRSEPSTTSFEGGTLKINARSGEDALSILEVKVTEKKDDGSAEMHTSNIPEASFDLLRVKESLNDHFNILDQLDERGYKNDDYHNKVFFVCKLASN